MPPVERHDERASQRQHRACDRSIDARVEQARVSYREDRLTPAPTAPRFSWPCRGGRCGRGSQMEASVTRGSPSSRSSGPALVPHRGLECACAVPRARVPQGSPGIEKTVHFIRAYWHHQRDPPARLSARGSAPRARSSTTSPYPGVSCARSIVPALTDSRTATATRKNACTPAA